MTIKILKEDTGKGIKDYQNDGILKRALKREGYKDVYVVANTEWNGTKTWLWGAIKRKYEGQVNSFANNRIFDLSLNESKSDIILKLD